MDRAPSEPAVLELSQLRGRCLGNDQLVLRILSKIQPTLAAEHDRLRSALDQGDAEAVAVVAHRLKGTAANIGAQQYLEVVHDLEMSARKGGVSVSEDLLPRFGQLQRACKGLCETIVAVSARCPAEWNRAEATS